MTDGYEYVDDSWNSIYLEDVEIAKKEIKNMKLYPKTGILCELYAIPSHNYQTYYAVIYEDEGILKMVYAKSQIYVWFFSEPIKMYTFKEAKKADNHPAYMGKIIMGMRRLDEDFSRLITDIINNIQDGCSLDSRGAGLDGVFQAIQVYGKEKTIKQVSYWDADRIALPADKEYLRKELNNLYITVDTIIGG